MIRNFADSSFNWIDILEPTPEDLQKVASQHNLHQAFITDILQPEHLPKYEPVGNMAFFILRYYAAEDNTDQDTIQGLTNKIAIFQTEKLVITIHRFEIDFIDDLKKNFVDAGECSGTVHLLNRIIKAVFQTYEAPADRLAKDIDFYESQTFLKRNPPPVLKGVYHIKRQIEVTRRLLMLSKDTLEHVDAPEHQDPNTRDTRDLYIRLLSLYDAMSENTNHLLTLYFSVSAQRTNEVIRVLTIFSVFFMPLTFIVGIYGMNFDFMPELHWKIGYPGIMLIMAGVTIAIYLWFRSKHWL
ncbi:MAG: CorA family divalent cation transporter [Chryseolinea sp.]